MILGSATDRKNSAKTYKVSMNTKHAGELLKLGFASYEVLIFKLYDN